MHSRTSKRVDKTNILVFFSTKLQIQSGISKENGELFLFCFSLTGLDIKLERYR